MIGVINFKSTEVYQCKTKELAKLILIEADKQGYAWCSKHPFTHHSNWKVYEDLTTYDIIAGDYDDITGYKGQTIIDAGDLITYPLSLRHREWMIRLKSTFTMQPSELNLVRDVLFMREYTYQQRIILNEIREKWLAIQEAIIEV